MKNITRILSAALALCLLAALCLPARADGTQDCGAKLLAITFDDGPGKYTGALLDGLAERGVHATFFVNGVNASGWPETLKRIVNEGHQLANHTYNHKNLNTCSAQTVAYEISAVQALITAAGGDENAYIRAPYGNANKTVKSVVTAPLIYWSVDRKTGSTVMQRRCAAISKPVSLTARSFWSMTFTRPAWTVRWPRSTICWPRAMSSSRCRTCCCGAA